MIYCRSKYYNLGVFVSLYLTVFMYICSGKFGYLNHATSFSNVTIKLKWILMNLVIGKWKKNVLKLLVGCRIVKS